MLICLFLSHIVEASKGHREVADSNPEVFTFQHRDLCEYILKTTLELSGDERY